MNFRGVVGRERSHHRVSLGCEVHQNNLTPNSSSSPSAPVAPVPYKGRGVRIKVSLLVGEGKGIMFLAGRGVKIKASLLVGDRSFSEEFGERSESIASN